MTQQAERRRDRTSFQELAKMAQTPPPPSMGEQVSSKSGPLSSPAASNPLVWPSSPNVAGGNETGPWSGAESDSGMVDLKAIATADAAAANQAQERAKATALASEGLFEDAPAAASSAPPVPSANAGDRTTMPSAGGQPTSQAAIVAASAGISGAPAVSALSSVASVAAVPQAREEKKRGGVVIGLVAAFGAIAAGAFFYVQQHHAAPPPVAMPPQVEVKAPATPAATPAPVQPAQEVAPVAETPSEPVAVAKDEHTSKSGRKPKAGGGGKVALAEGPKEAPVAAAAEAAPAPAKAVGPFTGGSLKDEMEKRSGGEKGPAPEVAQDNGARGTQPKPSQGQVTGAIGAVLMKARECLGPDDPVSKANVVFASSGAVQSVSVSGGAAGKPAEACIKTALGKAKVPPFADAIYSFPVTVRPL